MTALACACGSKFATNGGAPDAGDAAVDVSAPAVDAAPDAGDASVDVGVDASDAAFDASACNVRTEDPAVLASPHVSEGTYDAGAPAGTYDSNPPSSGPHYPIWANFQEFANPVPDGYLVHSEEHGAILLVYKCADSTCPILPAALRAVRDAFPTDALCDPSIRVRIVLAPRPDNDAPVAAAAWGHVYKADCVDAASLTAWMTAHYAMGPENFCSPGQTTF